MTTAQPSSAPVKVRRNRAQTEARLRRAVEELLVQGGFAALTPSAVGKQAGVDKMLIYRYFGDLPGLIRAIAFAPDFFPSYDDLCPQGERDGMRALPLGERASLVLARYAEALLARPVVLELMVWELVERNDLTAIMEEARETMGLKLMADLFPDAPDQTRLAAMSAVLTGGITYLALRRRKIRWFGGLDLQSDAGWAAILSAVSAMAAVG